jgi:hypothetical protein
MPDIVIKTENLGKKYVIGHQAERVPYLALRDVLMQNARTPNLYFSPFPFHRVWGNRGT